MFWKISSFIFTDFMSNKNIWGMQYVSVLCHFYDRITLFIYLLFIVFIIADVLD